MPTSQRPRLLTAFAVAFALLGISNLLKPLELSGEHGFVLLGRRLQGTPNLVAGPAFGLVLLVYAYGIWRMRRWALGLGVAYATYVVANLALFAVHAGDAAPPLAFRVAYAAGAIGVSSGAAYLLARSSGGLA